MYGEDTNWLTPRQKTCRIHPSWQGLLVLKAIHSRFVTNLAEKSFDNSAPDVWKRHQLAHTAAENISYTPILVRASSSENSTLTFCHKLSRKTFWWLHSRCMEKTPTGTHCGGKYVIYTHPGEGLRFWKQYTLKLQGGFFVAPPALNLTKSQDLYNLNCPPLKFSKYKNL